MFKLKLNLICGLIVINLLTACSFGATQILDLSTTTGTGQLYLTNVNNESIEPNTAGGKDFDYPYYFDASQNLWVVIVSEQLSAATTYTFEETNFTVVNKTVTDPAAGQFDIGDLSWDDSSLTGSGIEVIGVAGLSLTLDASDFSPINSSRNVNNEFAWDYALSASNFSGTGLTFTDGILTSMDFSVDVSVTPQLLGTLAFGSSYDGTLMFAGDTFAFDVDVIQDTASPLGTLTDTHLLFDAAGTIVIPEPSSALLLSLGLCYLFSRRRGKR